MANFLKFLDKNESAYYTYLEWRENPLGLATLRLAKPWCKLCQKLMVENDCSANLSKSATASWYDDIYSWWFLEGSCTSPNKKYF